MENLIIHGTEVDVNEEGYFVDPSQWTEDIARDMAMEYDIELSDKHMEVLNYLRDMHAQEVPLTIRKVGKSGVTNIKEFYQLFPGGPLKISSKLAGIPKPVSCV